MKAPLLVLALLISSACQSSESHRVLETPTVESYQSNYRGPKSALTVGKFNNTSPYLQGIFSDGVDRLGNQARTILKTHLTQTSRFDLYDRENMSVLEQEGAITGKGTQLEGADIVVTGQVTEFGRRNTGDKQLFGILGRGKKQVAYTKVSVLLVDARTSRIIYSVQGAGEFSLSDREVIGFGSSSGYDSTLNGKVLNLAITDAVNKLVRALDSQELDLAGGAQ
jgi:curli biogenesis system outer membrane secretion channel CsgG